jgi:hypothetical protein
MSSYSTPQEKNLYERSSQPWKKNPDAFCKTYTKPFEREYGTPIEYSLNTARYIQDQVKKAFCFDEPYLYDPPPSGLPFLDGEIKRFICALAAYRDPFSKPVLPLQQLIDGILDKDFCSYLKKVRFKSLVKSIEEGTLTQEDPELDKVEAFYIRDIGSIFNYRYWIFWDTEDPEDELWANEPLPPTDISKYIEEYKETLKQVLPDTVDVVEEEEILLQSTSSGCVNERTGLPTKVYIEKQDVRMNCFSSKPLKSKLVYVQKCPGDTRRASVLTVPQSNTIKLIEKQVAKIAKNVTDSIYVTSVDDFKERFNSFKRDHEFFLCRDIKKDGLTKLRSYVQATLEVIQEKYPNLPMNKYKDIFSSWTYYKAETPHILVKPPRGVGLGMTSAITTLMQSAHKRLVVKRILQDPGRTLLGKVGAIAYHDDIAIGFEYQHDLDEFDSAEDTYFEDIGVIKNKKKTFSGKDFVCCEHYSSSLNDKKSYQMNLVLAPFAATNIVHAKQLLQQLLKYPTDIDVMAYVPKYQAYWGYEFVIEEGKLPFRMGGWVPSEYLGVDTSFVYYNKANASLSQSLMSAAACQQIEGIIDKPLRKDKSPFKSPVEQLFGPQLEMCGYESSLNYGLTMKEIHVKMTNFMSTGMKAEAYKRLLAKREFTFKKCLTLDPIPLDKFYMKYCSWYPFKDIIPPKDLYPEVDLEELSSEIGRKYHVIPQPSNPILSFLHYYNPDNVKLNKTIPCPLPPVVSMLSTNVALSNEEIKRLAIGGSHVFGGLPVSRNIIKITDGYCFFDSNWSDPYAVANAWCALHTLPRFPLVPPGDNLLWKELRKWRTSHFSLWWHSTPYKKSYQELVSRLGWERCNRVEIQDDYFLEQLYIYINSHKPKEPPKEPENIPLPAEDLEEYKFFFRDALLSYSGLTDDVKRSWESDYGDDVRSLNSEENKEFWDNFIPDSFSDNESVRYQHSEQSDFNFQAPIPESDSGSSTDRSLIPIQTYSGSDSESSYEFSDHG